MASSPSVCGSHSSGAQTPGHHQVFGRSPSSSPLLDSLHSFSLHAVREVTSELVGHCSPRTTMTIRGNRDRQPTKDFSWQRASGGATVWTLPVICLAIRARYRAHWPPGGPSPSHRSKSAQHPSRLELTPTTGHGVPRKYRLCANHADRHLRESGLKLGAEGHPPRPLHRSRSDGRVSG